MPLPFKTNDIERMRITEDGLIGIGNATPTVALDITGDLKLSGNADIGGDLSLGGIFKVDFIEAKTLGGDITINSNTLFKQNAYISGKLGIGTTSPGEELSVIGNSTISGNGYYGGYFGIGVSSPTSKLDVDGNFKLSGSAYIGNTLFSNTISPITGSLINITSPFNAIDAFYSGNIGIGVSSPTVRLDVNGDIKLTGSSYIETTLFTNTVSPITGNLITITSPFNANDAYYSGNVGIGVNAPDEKLKVGGNIHTTGLLKTGTGILYPDGTTQVTAYDPTSTVEARDLVVSHRVDLATDPTGKVVIGNKEITAGNHTNFKLSVDGKVVFKEGVVTADNWADYVFKEDYKLSDLDFVKKFISTRGHLPGVPSEKDVIENGINIAQMDAILLEKIEELTLYIIKQDEKINALEEKINQKQ